MRNPKTKPKVKLSSLSLNDLHAITHHDLTKCSGTAASWRNTALDLKSELDKLSYKISTIRPSIAALVGSDRIALFALRELAAWLDKQGPHDA